MESFLTNKFLCNFYLAICSGYTPPEYLFGRKVSKKFDIFSLGVVMTKIIAGPSDHDTHDEMQKEFLEHVRMISLRFDKKYVYFEQYHICML